MPNAVIQSSNTSASRSVTKAVSAFGKNQITQIKNIVGIICVISSKICVINSPKQKFVKGC